MQIPLRLREAVRSRQSRVECIRLGMDMMTEGPAAVVLSRSAQWCHVLKLGIAGAQLGRRAAAPILEAIQI